MDRTKGAESFEGLKARTEQLATVESGGETACAIRAGGPHRERRTAGSASAPLSPWSVLVPRKAPTPISCPACRWTNLIGTQRPVCQVRLCMRRPPDSGALTGGRVVRRVPVATVAPAGEPRCYSGDRAADDRRAVASRARLSLISLVGRKLLLGRGLIALS